MSHATLLFEHEFFPWGGLPYPCEHAKRGLDFLRKGDREVAMKAALFQQATLDHRNRSIYSFFQQERGCRFVELDEANRVFFHELGVQPKTEYHFIDPELGILFHRTKHQTVMCLASGCKSGMGAFLVREGGVLNFGPQLHPLGECGGFGLAGRGENIHIAEERLRYRCRLAAPHDRDTGIPWLRDSGYSRAWMDSECLIDAGQLVARCTLKGCRPPTDFLFTCFLKAQACFVAGSHKLTPRSLDRYQGPPQWIQIDGVQMIPESGFHSMEVVPLAGDESFWGTDFMVALSIRDNLFQMSMKKT